MATLTHNFQENEETSHQSYWTLNFTGTNATVTASGQTSLGVSIGLKAKYQANKTRAYLRVIANGLTWQAGDSADPLWWDNNELINVGSRTYYVNPSSLFTASNKTVKTVNIPFSITYRDAYSFLNDWDHYNAFESSATVSLGTIATVTLNVPPICTATTTSSGTYYAGISTYSVNISGLTAYYGGTISSVVLNVGGVTASRSTNGALSVTVPSASGNYTPTVTVTDSRGQTKSYSMTAITVVAHTLPTLTPTVTSSAPYYNIGTTYSAEVSDITTYEGASVSSIALRLGAQEDAKTSSFTDPFEISPNTVGRFTPQIIITDSYGATNTIPLADIDVLRYTPPTVVSFNVIRANANGTTNDEGESAVITGYFSWVDAVYHLAEPTVEVTDLDGNVQVSSVTWYTAWTSSGGVSGEINNWASIVLTNPITPIYGLVKNSTSNLFDKNESYNIKVTPNDSKPNSGASYTQTLGSAFYTVDFRAGGHGIAFGQPSLQDGFFCNMDAHFVDKADVMRALFDFVYPVGSYYETSDTSFNPNVTWGGTWQLETEGLVHISAGTNYPVSGAPTDTKDGGDTTSATGNHTLTTSEIPAHTHGQRSLTGNWYCVNLNSVTADGIMSKAAYSSSAYTGFSSNNRAGSKVTINATHTHDSVGGGGAHNHGNVSTMQPFIVVNRWHRIA
ncbi:MAG: hypothetical protein MJ128_05205 [Mogibacterium sp.]|nr:hypothetical protein [Mogibacterium sp.]